LDWNPPKLVHYSKGNQKGLLPRKGPGFTLGKELTVWGIFPNNPRVYLPY